MTRKDKTQIAAELSKLKSILQETNNTDLWQKLEDSDGKKAIMDNLEYSIKAIQTQIDNLELSVPERIARNLFAKKPAVHFNLHPNPEPTAKPFDFSVFARRAMQLLRGEG